MKILMVCLGNICRSPAAEGIFRDRFPAITFDSAGTGPWHVGKFPDHRSIAVCKKHDVDISMLLGRQVTAKDGEVFDLIFSMDRNNTDDLYDIIPTKNHHKIHMIDVIEVSDPYFATNDGFEIMFQHLEKAADKWAVRFEAGDY